MSTRSSERFGVPVILATSTNELLTYFLAYLLIVIDDEKLLAW